jgi:hypothetical protein
MWRFLPSGVLQAWSIGCNPLGGCGSLLMDQHHQHVHMVWVSSACACHVGVRSPPRQQGPVLQGHVGGRSGGDQYMVWPSRGTCRCLGM